MARWVNSRMAGESVMVLAITAPAPASMHFFMLAALRVGSADAAAKGFLNGTPQKFTRVSAMMFVLIFDFMKVLRVNANALTAKR
ncbi:MAG: hypothetical protein U5K27_09065 [Desulfotignum sp.]|nr:hypothetical protein [Desulfotignum sp.]